MRIGKEQVQYLKKEVAKYLSNFTCYLFGSRIDDRKKGGDIDIMVLSKESMDSKARRAVKISFYKEFGDQKIDLIHFRYDDPSHFKEWVMSEGVKL